MTKSNFRRGPEEELGDEDEDFKIDPYAYENPHNYDDEDYDDEEDYDER